MSVETGRKAEDLAARWLTAQGFRILNRNWRTRWCELDVVAERNAVIHVIEVKYRRRADFGTGFDYITPDKIGRLQRAALMWLHAHNRTNDAFQIDVIAITGEIKPKNLEYLPNAVAW